MSDDIDGVEVMLLFDIYEELRRIRMILDDDDTAAQAFCVECSEIVHEDDIESHAESKHNWHTALGDDLLNRLYVHDYDGE